MEEKERGIYLYPTRMDEESFGGQRNINTLDDLKRELLADINDHRSVNYVGWSSERYDKAIAQVQKGSIDDVLEYMTENRISLSTRPPIEIAGNYFDKVEDKRLWIEPHELKVSGEKIEFSRVELPLNVERQIDVSLGTVQGVKERDQDRGHFAVVKDRFGEGYSMVRVDNKPEGHQLNVKRGFKSLEDADKQIDNQLGRESLKPNKEMEKTPSMEISR
ncbi:hypothetical protein [Priestia megaterium]|uniref:hypothetical protein n=1 Tax=Priestia megaterium TaxID=1404 RepID=UPI000BFBBFE3|nr:hypothetical protein [Priestia megaterium]PGQ88342.1 hypothetical protein COA18_05275 [Priestia megaterium]